MFFFSFKQFLILYLNLWSILSRLSYVIWDKDPISFFCMWTPSFLNMKYWRDYLSSFYILGTLVEDQVTTGTWTFCFIGIMSVFIPVPCCLGYYSSVIHFEVRGVWCLHALLLLKLALVMWSPLWFHKNFRIFFFLWKMSLEFDRNFTESVDHFG